MTITPFRQLLNELHTTQADISRRYEIPLRTVQNWATGVNRCPPYVLSMLRRLEQAESPDR